MCFCTNKWYGILTWVGCFWELIREHFLSGIKSSSFNLTLKCLLRAIITRGLYILNPLFEGHKHFFKEVFSENSAFMDGQYSWAVSNPERVRVAVIQYPFSNGEKILWNGIHPGYYHTLQNILVWPWISDLYQTEISP